MWYSKTLDNDGPLHALPPQPPTQTKRGKGPSQRPLVWGVGRVFYDVRIGMGVRFRNGLGRPLRSPGIMLGGGDSWIGFIIGLTPVFLKRGIS